MLNRRPYFLLLGLTLALASRLFPQSEAASVAIRFTGGTSQFHVGEVIPIELSFAASIPDTYDMSTANYDRSGRLNIEKFNVTPPGRDPLLNYYSEGTFIGGGLSSSKVLTDAPQVMNEDLNEWVAIDNPGRYSVYITTGRVSRRTPAKNQPVQLRSNTLDFEVIGADREWQDQTLASALTVLNNSVSTDEEKSTALRKLRFMDTPGSIHELVKEFDALPDGRRFDCIAGLAGSHNQSLVVQELERQMSAPTTAITAEYIYTLAKLEFQLDHPGLPPYPEHDATQQKLWQERMQARQKDLSDLNETLYQKAESLALTKQGRAQTETIRTLLMRPWPGSGATRPIALPDNVVTNVFVSLSPDQQYNLLSSFWERLRIPSMAVPLETIVAQPEIRHQLLRDVALQRLYELAADQATPYILNEIQNPHIDNGFTVKAKTLSVLPEKTLPKFDGLLAARIEQKDSRTRPLDAQLIARYSTSAILPRVKAFYEAKPGLEDCVSEDGFVYYFLRTDPDYGVRRLAAVPSSCMSESIPMVIRLRRWGEVQPAVIAQTNNPDLNRARQAAETLARYGDDQAEKALWGRLRSFHKQWADRETELSVFRLGEPRREANEAIGFQYGLVESIAKAQNWTLTDEQVTELENLTLGSERDNVKHYHWNSPLECNVSVSLNGGFHADINHQYFTQDNALLQAKLGQYPSGTTFKINSFGPQAQLIPVLEEINQTASQHGLVIDLVH